MSTRVRSYAKVNLGLAIGGVRADGFHGLATLYQTLDLHDFVTVSARRAGSTSIRLKSNDDRVPCDVTNTAWRMVEGALGRMGVAAEVEIEIEKRLPVQGGMGAGSANGAAALIALEAELGERLGDAERLELAAGVGSDVPLFLIGGAVLGSGRGEVVEAVEDCPATACVVAVPEVRVSTPLAFRDWDALMAAGSGGGLTWSAHYRTLEELSRVYDSILVKSRTGSSGIVRGFQADGLAEDTLIALVRTGIGNDFIANDFEEVVFPQYPSLREIKRQLMGIETDEPALYAALSGSGSALFGLYGSDSAARAAQQRIQACGVRALITETLPRAEYWKRMFAESPHRA
jgi:4-diphosphocytidyl-2-C-methyl-D-erythritol kinase